MFITQRYTRRREPFMQIYKNNYKRSEEVSTSGTFQGSGQVDFENCVYLLKNPGHATECTKWSGSLRISLRADDN